MKKETLAMHNDTKDRILKGAEELFFQYGIKSITMDDIAKHLAISKKTIYHYFADKDEVVHILMKESLDKDIRDFTCIHNECKNIIDEIFAIMKYMSEMFGKINPIIFYDLQKYHPKSWKLFLDFKSDCILKMVEHVLVKGMQDGYVRKDVNPKILSILRMQEIEMGFNPAVFPHDKFQMLEVQLAMTEHFLYGICTLKGHKLINEYKHINEDE